MVAGAVVAVVECSRVQTMIVAHLTRKCRGNVHSNRIVTIINRDLDNVKHSISYGFKDWCGYHDSLMIS